jgi:DNA polymerase-1
LFYDRIKYTPYKGRRSTDKAAMEKLPQDEVVVALRDFRKVHKQLSTYSRPALKRLGTDGRVHSQIMLHGTRTGRPASKEPNVLNVPRDPLIRGQYDTPPGRRIIEVDYNQAELRVLSCFSRDPELCRIYLTEGLGLHDEVRAEIWGNPSDYSPQELTQQLYKFRLTPESRYDSNGKDLLVAEQKMKAKNVNFGVVYGITEIGLAEQTDQQVDEQVQGCRSLP